MVDDDRALCETIETGMRHRGFECTTASNAGAALDAIRNRDFDVVLTDVKLEGMDGLELCRQIVECRPELPVVVMTGFGSMESAVAAIRAGAYDFVTKPVDLDDLVLVVERAARHRALTQEVRRLRRVVDEARRFEEIIGESQEMQKVYDLTTRVAETYATMLITCASC